MVIFDPADNPSRCRRVRRCCSGLDADEIGAEKNAINGVITTFGRPKANAARSNTKQGEGAFGAHPAGETMQSGSAQFFNGWKDMVVNLALWLDL
jgi:hypothetical protein